MHDGLKVYNPRDEGTWYDADGVKEKFGVAPHAGRRRPRADGGLDRQHQGRSGDRRERRARSHRHATASLEALLAHAAEISNKRYREGLLAHAEDARQSRELARIRTDVPVEFDAESLRYRGASRERCFELFTPARIPHARDGVRADGRDDRQGLRARRARETSCASWRGALRTAGRFGFRVLPDAPSAMRSGIVGTVVLHRSAPRALRAARARRSAAATCSANRKATDDEAAASSTLDVIDARQRSRPCSKTQSIAKVGHDLKFDAIVLARHGVDAARASRPTRCWRATCSMRRARRIRSRISRSSTRATRRCARKTSAAAARRRSPFARRAARDRARLRRRTRRPGAAALRSASGAAAAGGARGASTTTWSCR